MQGRSLTAFRTPLTLSRMDSLRLPDEPRFRPHILKGACHLRKCVPHVMSCQTCKPTGGPCAHHFFQMYRAIIIEQLLRCQGYLSGVQEEVGQARERAAAGGEHVCRDAQLVEADFHSAQLDASPDGRVHGNEIQWPAYCNLTLSLLL